MTSPSTPPVVGEPHRGLVLLGGARTEVEAWVARTVVPVVVAPAAGWTIVALAGPTQVGAPYDDATTLLAGRPVPAKAAPALGFFVIDGRAVITAHTPTGRGKGPRWVVWEPDLGLLRPPGLELAGPAEITRLARCPVEVRDELVDLLHETRSRPITMVQAVMATLSLPGARLIAEPAMASSLPGATAHQPARKELGYFEDAVADSVRLRRELGALP